MKKYLYIMLLYLSVNTFADTYTDYDNLIDNAGGGNIVATMIDDNPYDWEMSATPINGYKFGYWNDFYGTIESFENPIRFTIDRENRNYGLQAVFVKDDAFIGGWIADSIIVRSLSTYMTDSDLGKAFLYVDDGEIEENLTTSVKIDHGIWRLYANDLFEDNKNAGKNLHLVLLNECDEPTSVINTVVPYIVNTECNASAISFAAAMDVEVLSDGILNINANTTINGFLDIHEGAKVVVEEGKNLTVNGIIMRGNGITKEWPQLEVDGTITNNNNDTIYYDYTLDQHAYYPLTLPFEVNCSEVYNPINKAAASYQAYTYNTENRENSVYAWDEFDDTVLGAKFVAGKGYIVYAVPTKWRGVKALRQQEAVVRFPMVADFSDGGEAEKLVDIYSNPSGEVYDCSNWNLIGNPYLKNITMGHVNVGKYRAYQGNLDGAGNFVEAAPPGSRSLNYITYSDDGFRSYQHEELSNFVMKPFNSYLTQTSVGSKLQFAKITTPLAAPRRAQTSSEEDVEIIRTGLLLTQGEDVDHIGLLFGDYSYDYEVNADLAKQFGEAQPMSVYSLMGNIPMAYQALPIDAMNRPVPVGYRKADITSMTFSFDDSRYAREQIEGLWLTDLVTGQTVNLLDEDYTFTPESAQDDSRFYLSCERPKVVEIATDVEETTQQQTIIRVFDMFGREMHGDVNALPQGVYILMDNLGNTKKEILGQ